MALSTKPNRFYPSVPSAGGTLDSVLNTVELMRTSMLTHERRDNNYMKSFVRFEELVDLGIITESGESTGTAGHAAVTLAGQNYLSLSGQQITALTIGVTHMSATGTPDATTFLRGDNTWATPAGGGGTFASLSDTDVTGVASGDLIFYNGATYNDTDGLSWDNVAGRLTLANADTVAWLNGAASPVDLLEFTAAVTGDPNWSGVQLLANLNGADAATTYTEASVNAASATFVGNAQLDTAQQRFGTASLLLDGTGDYITFPDIAAYDLGTSDWTIEGWVRFNVLPPLETSAGPGFAFYSMRDTGDLITYAVIQDGFGYRVRITGNGFAEVGTIAGGITTGVWYHWGVTRTAGQIRAYFNGNYEIGDFGAAPADMGGPTSLYIGSIDGASAFHNGWIDSVRMNIGTALYTGTGTYTIPTAEFPEGPSIAETLTIGDVTYPTVINGLSVLINGLDVSTIVSNATHTGEVTGATTLTVQPESITNKAVLPTLADPTDEIAVHDLTDGSLKKSAVNLITDGGYF